ncbi:MAG: transposase [Chromatiales bacterium]|nr:transposase [Gammaproteobacteria bacterium]
MARLPRLSPPNIPQHIIQRGNNRQACFAAPDDFAAYAHWLHEAAEKYSVAIHAWVFMTNHVHLLATPKSHDSISKMMQFIGRHYVRHFNHSYKRSGTLWEGRFKSCVVDAENYLLICQRYIELNPIRAGMVDNPAEYHWSSYHANGLNRSSSLRTAHAEWLRLGKTDQQRAERYRGFFKGHHDTEQFQKIRDSTNMGMALGNDRFKAELEELTGRRVTPCKRGPTPKNSKNEKSAKGEFLL